MLAPLGRKGEFRNPDARINRAGANGAQFAVIVLHPRPPHGEHVARRQPDVGGLVEDFERHFADDLLAFCFVSRQYAVALLERAASLAVPEAA